MSVINQMLLDLQARDQAQAQADAVAPAMTAMPAGLRAAPAPVDSARRLRWLLAALVATGVLAALWSGWQFMQARQPTVLNTAPPVESAGANAAPPTATPPEPASPSADATAQNPAAPGTVGAEPGASLTAMRWLSLHIDGARSVVARTLESTPEPKPAPGSYPPATPAVRVAPGNPVESSAARREVQVESKSDAARAAEPSPRQQAEAETRHGQDLARAGRMLDAIDAFDRALVINRTYTPARLGLANTLVELKRVDEAMTRLQEGLDENRANGTLAMRLARLQLDRGDTRAAIETLGHSLPYDRSRPDHQVFMAGLLQKEGRNGEAIDYYLTALRRAPHNAAWWMGLGQTLQAEKRFPEAREALQRAQSVGGLSPEQQSNVQQRLEQMR